MKEKTTKPKSKKEIVLDGDNPQDYAEWETEAKFKIKSKLGEIGLEHFHGRQNYTLSEERGENGKFVKIIDKTSERRAPSPLEADGPRLKEGSAVDDTVDPAESASVSRVSDSEAGREGAEGTG